MSDNRKDDSVSNAPLSSSNLHHRCPAYREVDTCELVCNAPPCSIFRSFYMDGTGYLFVQSGFNSTIMNKNPE
jgi:hypothetical protein